MFFKWLKYTEDPLVGLWHTSNDSGIHVLYGSAIHFQKGGKGIMNSWGGSDDADDPIDPSYNYECSIDWIRLDNDTIKIKKTESIEWVILNYKVLTETGSHGVYYDKIISIGNHSVDEIIKEWFWDIPEALYRQQKL